MNEKSDISVAPGSLGLGASSGLCCRFSLQPAPQPARASSCYRRQFTSEQFDGQSSVTRVSDFTRAKSNSINRPPDFIPSPS